MVTDETDIALAEEAAHTAPKYRAARSVDGADQIGSLGLTPAEATVEEGFVDPTIVQILYHRFDGRTIVVPAYMSPKLLAMRIPTTEPHQYAGMTAWSVNPTNNYVPGEVKCLLHEEQTEDVKRELEAIGLSSGRCKKAHIHSEYDLERHMELKHKREWAAVKQRRELNEREADRNAMRSQGDALVKMAEVLASNAQAETKRGPGRPPKGE